MSWRASRHNCEFVGFRSNCDAAPKPCNRSVKQRRPTGHLIFRIDGCLKNLVLD